MAIEGLQGVYSVVAIWKGNSVKNERDRLFFTQLFVPQASQSSYDRRAELDVRLAIPSAQSACGMEIKVKKQEAWMGKQNDAFTAYLGRAEVLADLYNGCLYQGEEETLSNQNHCQ